MGCLLLSLYATILHQPDDLLYITTPFVLKVRGCTSMYVDLKHNISKLYSRYKFNFKKHSFQLVLTELVETYQNLIMPIDRAKAKLRGVECVALIWFLFGMCHY